MILWQGSKAVVYGLHFLLMSPCLVCICARLSYLSSLLSFKESSCLSIGFNFSMSPDRDREMASLSSVPFFFALPESVSSHAIPLESPSPVEIESRVNCLCCQRRTDCNFPCHTIIPFDTARSVPSCMGLTMPLSAAAVE